MKLSKEQSAYLLEKLGDFSFDLYGIDTCTRTAGQGFTHETMCEFIRMHAEKEFPRHMPDNAPMQIDYAPENKSSFIKIMLLDDDFVNCAKYLDCKEFKEFAQGVRAVDEYLDERA